MNNIEESTKQNNKVAGRSERVNIRLTVEQKAQMKSQAEANGMSITNYILYKLNIL